MALFESKDEEYERGVKDGQNASGLSGMLGNIIPGPDVYKKGWEFGRQHPPKESEKSIRDNDDEYATENSFDDNENFNQQYFITENSSDSNKIKYVDLISEFFEGLKDLFWTTVGGLILGIILGILSGIVFDSNKTGETVFWIILIFFFAGGLFMNIKSLVRDYKNNNRL